MKTTKPIRVCIVVASTDILGGQSIQSLRLLEGLSREPGLEARLLPINPRLPGPLRLLQRIKYVRTVVTSIAYIALLLVRLPRFDVVHIFSASYLSFLLAPAPAILIAKLYGKPILLNYHSGEADDHLRRWPRTTFPLMALANRVVVPSEYLVQVFAGFGIRAEAISNTVDLERFRFRDREPLKPVLLSNRNFENNYSIECALRAFALIERSVPEASLIVAGDGSHRERLYKLASELEIKNIEFLGAVPPRDMPALYDRADIFINSSVVDNQPLSIIEAFAAGLPVVTTNAGGIPFMVKDGETGMMTERGDHKALAASVIRLLENSALASYVASRARQECRKYSWSAVAEKWIKLYRDLAFEKTKAGIEQIEKEKSRAVSGA